MATKANDEIQTEEIQIHWLPQENMDGNVRPEVEVEGGEL
jgi:hypothetical protein